MHVYACVCMHLSLDLSCSQHVSTKCINLITRLILSLFSTFIEICTWKILCLSEYSLLRMAIKFGAWGLFSMGTAKKAQNLINLSLYSFSSGS